MENWTREHFITYIFFCIAYSDSSIDENEMDIINKFVMLSVDCDELSSSLIDDVKKVIVSHNQLQKEQYIEQNISRFIVTEAGKEKLITGIEEIIIADYNVESDEMEFYRFLKRLLRD